MDERMWNLWVPKHNNQSSQIGTLPPTKLMKRMKRSNE
jgi:hypothetical protein